MSITLHVEPKTKPMSFSIFKKRTPMGSISIDGYVDGPSSFCEKTLHINFDHHKGVNRSATRATCAQVLLAIRQGLFDSFGSDVHIYANDCDEDVCLTYYLLKHTYRSKNVIDPSLNRLVMMVDMLDTTAGAYPFPADLPLLEELAWVFEPYRRARLNGLLATKDAAIFQGIIEDVEHRIAAHICGRGGRLAMDTRYRVIAQYPQYTIVEETGSHARTGMIADGVKAFVSVRTRPNGQYDYVIGKISDYIPFPIPHLFAALNEFEKCEDDRWGGASTIGGSPRVDGSSLSPEQVSFVINQALSQKT